MTQPLVTIITPTYNRPAMFAECAAAVLAQSFTDWTWWVVFNCASFPYDYCKPDCNFHDKLWSDIRFVPIWYPVQEYQRERRYLPAEIINWLYPKVTTPYIYFLADDDLIDSEGLGVLIDATYPDFRGDSFYHSGRDAVYGRCEVIDQQPDGSYKHGAWCYPGENAEFAGPFTLGAFDVGLGTGVNPNCLLDGGQVLHTAELWRKATADGWQLTDANADAAACDGLLLARLAEFARFHYVPQRIVTHRRHAGAAHHKPQVTK
jgi:Glycosyl transferase family 2